MEIRVEMELEAGSISQNMDPVNQEKNWLKSTEVSGSHFPITEWFCFFFGPSTAVLGATAFLFQNLIFLVGQTQGENC